MIRLSRLSDYGIVIMTRLAREPGRAMPASTLARATSVSAAMTGKILKLLTRAEFLVSQRGVHGGYSLARPAEAISVAQIIEALCPAREGWRRINRAIRDALSGISLAEMAQAVPNGPVPPPLASATHAAGRAPRALARIGAG